MAAAARARSSGAFLRLEERGRRGGGGRARGVDEEDIDDDDDDGKKRGRASVKESVDDDARSTFAGGSSIDLHERGGAGTKARGHELGRR